METSFQTDPDSKGGMVPIEPKVIRVYRPIPSDRPDGSKKDRRFQTVFAILSLQHGRKETVFRRSSEGGWPRGRLASACQRAQLADARIVVSQLTVAIA